MAATLTSPSSSGWFESTLDLRAGLRVVEFGAPQDLVLPPPRAGRAGPGR